jgi:ACR3 family arsenite efflux pump ArsB
MKDEKRGALTGLRFAALIAVVIGAAGSLGLWIRAAQHPPPLIIVLFVVWVLSPFVVFGIGHVVAKRWAPSTQAALYWVTLLVTLASIAIYADDAVAHRTAHPAAVYVAVPPASWLVSAVAIGLGAWIAKKEPRLVRPGIE